MNIDGIGHGVSIGQIAGKGLAGVVEATTQLSHVDGERGELAIVCYWRL